MSNKLSSRVKAANLLSVPQSPNRAGFVQTTIEDTSSWPLVGFNRIKNGWVVADGSEMSQAAYPELYAIIGDRYNESQYIDNSGTLQTYAAPAAGNFRVPDFRNVYLRGDGQYALGILQDDATAVNGLGLTWSSSATTSVDGNHSHTQRIFNSGTSTPLSDSPQYSSASSTRNGGETLQDGSHSHTINKSQWNSNQSWDGDSETRPKTAVVQYIIKMHSDSGSVSISLDEVSLKGTLPSAQSPASSEPIPAGADLNDYRTAGFYFQGSNAGASSGSNYPVSNNAAGSLRVEVSADGVTQFYTIYRAGGSGGLGGEALATFVRGYTSSGLWSPWLRVVNDDGEGNVVIDGDLTIGGVITDGVAPIGTTIVDTTSNELELQSTPQFISNLSVTLTEGVWIVGRDFLIENQGTGDAFSSNNVAHCLYDATNGVPIANSANGILLKNDGNDSTPSRSSQSCVSVVVVPKGSSIVVRVQAAVTISDGNTRKTVIKVEGASTALPETPAIRLTATKIAIVN